MQGGPCHWALCLALGTAVGTGACGESHASEPDAGTAGDATVGEGASCEVGGVVYHDGDTGIDDPFSCNTCACEDGVLVTDLPFSFTDGVCTMLCG
jgi:hypothetical protein